MISCRWRGAKSVPRKLFSVKKKTFLRKQHHIGKIIESINA